MKEEVEPGQRRLKVRFVKEDNSKLKNVGKREREERRKELGESKEGNERRNRKMGTRENKRGSCNLSMESNKSVSLSSLHSTSMLGAAMDEVLYETFNTKFHLALIIIL